MSTPFERLRDVLRDVQSNTCGICASPDPDLVVDHDHASGFVRGLLCRSCNVLEGFHGDCEDVALCPTCTWRRCPAVAFVGWTVHHAGPTAIVPTDRYASCADRVKRVVASRVAARASAERRAARLDGRYVDGQAVAS